MLDGEVETEIVQASRVFHTGANPMERLLLRPQFDGPVTPGTAYALVDDVTCLGGTLAELADYIQAAGGKVAAFITLVNAGRLKALKPEPLLTRRLREKFPDAIQHTFGIDPGALTANEASYLSGFRTADELRNRAAKAAEDNDRRLRAKGFQLEARPAPLKILESEPQDDIFVSWKPLHQQPIGWDPDINDGVRLNIRPFLVPIPEAPPAGDSFDGNRWNDPHDSRAANEAARARQGETS